MWLIYVKLGLQVARKCSMAYLLKQIRHASKANASKANASRVKQVPEARKADQVALMRCRGV